jgi:glycosyltransferase involved in cell wall biosynthesis
VLKAFYFGSPHHTEVVSGVLSSLGFERTSLKEAELLYWIAAIPTAKRLRYLMNFMSSRDKKLVIHWIGSDVHNLITPRNLIKKSYGIFLGLLTSSYSDRTLNLAGSSWLQEELETKGIESIVLPVTTISPSNYTYPDRDSTRETDVLTYTQKRRFDFYGSDTILDLARELPEYRFKFLFGDVENLRELPTTRLENVTFLPRITFEEMKETYLDSKCFLRIPLHDGLSLSILEALYFKMQAIWSYSFPHVVTVDKDDKEEIRDELRSILEGFTENESGHDYVIKEYSKSRITERYERIMPKLGDLDG